MQLQMIISRRVGVSFSLTVIASRVSNLLTCPVASLISAFLSRGVVVRLMFSSISSVTVSGIYLEDEALVYVVFGIPDSGRVILRLVMDFLSD